MAVQLRDVETIVWAVVEELKDKHSVFDEIDITTFKYWMDLLVPIFLCVHEQIFNTLLIDSRSAYIAKSFVIQCLQ